MATRWCGLTVLSNYAEATTWHTSKGITKESEKLKTTITEYNGLVSPTEKLSWEQVTDLSLSLVHTPSEDSHPQVYENGGYRSTLKDAACYRGVYTPPSRDGKRSAFPL